MPSIIASIIICTYNRSAVLRQALAALSEQSYPADQFEIVVVDNNSSDDTKQVVAEAASSSSVRISSFMETRQGLSHARNTGIKEARGTHLAFIDDDALADRNWLEKLMQEFNDPSVACVGGKVLPSWTRGGEWPPWLSRRHQCFFSVIDYAHKKKLRHPCYPRGTNMAFRKTVLSEIGSFKAQLGRSGTSLLSGEEIELCLRIGRTGCTILYTPDAVVRHKLDQNRLTQEWVRQRAHWQGVTDAVIEGTAFTKGKKNLKIMKYKLFIIAGSIGKHLFKRMKKEKPAFFCECQVILCRAYLEEIVKRCAA